MQVLAQLANGEGYFSSKIRDAVRGVGISIGDRLEVQQQAWERPGFRGYGLDLNKCSLQVTELFEMPKLRAVQKQIKERLTERQTFVISLIQEAMKSTGLLRKELLDDLSELLAECTQRLKQLEDLKSRIAQDTRSQRAVEAQLAQCNAELARVQAEVEAKKAECKAIGDDCQRRLEQREKEEARLATVFNDVLEATLKAARPQTQHCKIEFFSFEKKQQLEKNLRGLIEREVQLAFVTPQIESPLKFEITYVEGGFLRSPEVVVWLHANGMEAPLKKTFALNGLEDNLQAFLIDELPRWRKVFLMYAELQAWGCAKAEEQMRALAREPAAVVQVERRNDPAAPANLAPTLRPHLLVRYPELPGGPDSIWRVD